MESVREPYVRSEQNFDLPHCSSIFPSDSSTPRCFWPSCPQTCPLEVIHREVQWLPPSYIAAHRRYVFSVPSTITRVSVRFGFVCVSQSATLKNIIGGVHVNRGMSVYRGGCWQDGQGDESGKCASAREGIQLSQKAASQSSNEMVGRCVKGTSRRSGSCCRL